MKYLTETTKEIRAELKKLYPECKWSVTTKHGLDINVHLMAAPESPFASLDYVGPHYEQYPASHDGTDVQLNHYYVTQDYQGRWISNCVHLTEKAAKMFLQVVEIAQRDNWNNSDSQTDYFDVNYYLHLAVGKWDKPFQVV